MKTVEQTIFEMMTENTGRHMLDSGGAYGRNWERNQKKTLQDFKDSPAATLEIRYWEHGKTFEFMPCVNVFHKLTDGCIDLDDLCHTFNAMECDLYNGDYYGTNADQSLWLLENGFAPNKDSKDAFNTYNWDNNFSQILQGQFLTHESSDETYLLLQIHGGCDARGGYTDAKLFHVNTAFQEHHRVVEDPNNPDEYLSMDWMGEWINREGTCPDDDEYKAFALAAGAKPDGESVFLHGDIYE